MTVISSKEFISNQERYFDIAIDEDVYVKNGENMFMVSIANQQEEPDMIFEPDEDFYNSISMEEVRGRLHKVIDKLYMKR